MIKLVRFLCLMLLVLTSKSYAENPIFQAEHIGQCGTWELIIYASGYVHERYDNTCSDGLTLSTLHRLKAKQINDLKAAFTITRFIDLPNTIESEVIVIDGDYYRISNFTGGPKKVVTASELDRSTNRDHAQRFQRMWKEFVKILPDKYED